MLRGLVCFVLFCLSRARFYIQTEVFPTAAGSGLKTTPNKYLDPPYCFIQVPHVQGAPSLPGSWERQERDRVASSAVDLRLAEPVLEEGR